MSENQSGRGAPPAAWSANGPEAVAARRYGLPPDTAAAVLVKAKDCPVLNAQRFAVGGSFDIKLFVEDPPGSGTLTNPIFRLTHGLRRPVEGLIVTRQNIAGDVLTLGPGDDEYDDYFFPPVGKPPPPPDLTREIILKASTVGLIVRALIF